MSIIRFAPYVYSYDVSDVENYAYEAATELAGYEKEQASDWFEFMCDMLSKNYNDEYSFHLFQASGEEVSLPDMDILTGKHIDDFENRNTSTKHLVTFLEESEPYTIFISKNVEKESLVVQALKKAFPLLSGIIVLVSIVAAFLYSWYMTTPIKKVSRVSRKMANMDFNELCITSRTDEIGVLADSLNELSERLTMTFSELQQANQKLQADIDMERQIERQRGEFFSAASHELKTPITIIKGQLQGMLCQVGRYKDRDMYLARSLETTNDLEKMVQNLLTISRLDTPEYVCNKRKLDFSVLLKNRLSSYEDLFVQKEQVVEQDILPDIQLLGDEELLRKVIDNLLSNAIIYSPAESKIYIKLWQENQKVILVLENTGVHIPNEDIPKLFEAFYRVEQSRNRQTGGSGLGLYIVKTILDLHDAKIDITNSAKGVITTVRF